MSDTPRADEAIAKSNGQWSYELRDLCCQLERDLAEAKKQRDKLEEALRIIDERILNSTDLETDLKFCGEVAFAALAAVKGETPKGDPHKFCRTTSHCGCRYDS